MKKLTRIFFAVAALFAFACTTDTTEDLGVQLGGKTVLSLSLEESRTQLGEKADGLYPLYWSEGDNVALNGVASTALTAEEAGGTGAIFTFEGALQRPYNIVYPAPAEGVAALTEGQYPVTFLAEQSYTAGSFCAGAAPMYGYAAADTEGDIQLNHLTGVIRIAVKGEGTILKHLTITSEKSALAGTFDVDCATGALTAHDDASNTIKVTFGEGLTLGTEATPIYVTVPAGDYGKIYVMLTSATDIMKLEFDSTAKPVKAGVVREFAEFTYEANADENDTFIIDSKESLIEFAKIAANFAPYTTAKVVAPIDMTGVEWTPIEEFGAFIFDGGEQEIKGLSAPLFSSTAAHIKNVKLTEVNIVETERIISGSIACFISGGSLTNCETSGSFEVNNTTYEEFGTDHGVRSIGCMVGKVVDSPITDCVNRINLTLTSIHKGATTNTDYDFAGVVGAVVNTVDQTYTNLTNHGSISYAAAGTRVRAAVAGIAGYSKNAKYSKIYNHGNIVLNEYTYCTYFGGLFGFIANTDVHTAENHGALTMNAGISYNYMGGIVGDLGANTRESTFEEVDNYGAIESKADVTMLKTFEVGGFCGLGTKADWVVKNCDNHGNITIASKQSDAAYIGGLMAGTNAVLSCCNNYGAITITGDCAAGLYVGGVVAVHTPAITGDVLKDCTNSGAITISSNLIGSGTTVGGIAGYFNKSLAGQVVSGCVNKAEGAISFTSYVTSTASIGGVGGNVKAHNISGCDNYAAVTVSRTPAEVETSSGTITASATATSTICVAGVIAYHNASPASSTLSDCENHGVVTMSSIENKGQVHVAGVVGYEKNADCAVSSLTNASTGKVIFDGGTTYEKFYMGGCVALLKSPASTLQNDGNVELLGSVEGLAYYGGVVGSAELALSSLTSGSTASVLVGEKASLKGLLFGGVVGYAAKGLDGAYNNGTVTYKGDTTMATGESYFSVGGVTGRCTGSSKDLFNYSTGTVTVAGKFTASLTKKYGFTSIGGVAGTMSSGDHSNVHNYATVNISSTIPNAKWNEEPFVFAGCMGYVTSNLSNVSNEGALNISCNSESDKQLRISGVFGRGSNDATDTYDNIVNKGKITITGTSTDSFIVAGVNAYNTKSTYSNICNEGEILIDATAKTDTDIIVGGVFSATGDTGTTKENIVNKGAITIKGKAAGTVYVGGLYATGGLLFSCGTNLGKITVERPEGSTAAYIIGGAVANPSVAISGAEVYCDIEALGLGDQNIGMIKGSPRVTVTTAEDGTTTSTESLVSNCKLGGKLATTLTEKEDANGEMTTMPDWITLDATNFHDYIYGGTTDWTGVDGYDGCSFLTVKPEI